MCVSGVLQVQQLLVRVAVDEVTLRVFGVIQRECIDPCLCAGLTLFPVVQRPVLKVTLGFVCADGEGGTSHS